MEISAIKGGSDAKWQMPLKISISFFFNTSITHITYIFIVYEYHSSA